VTARRLDSNAQSGKRLRSLAGRTADELRLGIVERLCGDSTSDNRGVQQIYDWPELFSELRKQCEATTQVSIDFFRHGESEANALGLVTGAWDVPLTDRGRREARDLGLRLRHQYDMVWSSSLIRSRDTTQIALEAKCSTMLCFCTDTRLNERALGVLERSKRVHVPEYAAGDLQYAPPNGESYLEVTQRVLSFLVDLRRVLKMTHSTRALVSTHAGPLRVIRAIFCNVPDASAFMAAEIHHAELWSVHLDQLIWPRFLPNLEEVNASGAQQHILPNRASRHKKL
jgi:probable phosphoglycerate mutase